MPSARRVVAETLELRRHFAATDFPALFGGPGFDNAQKIVQSGQNYIVVGQFSGTTNFARPGDKARTLTAQGDTDGYVAAYGPTGSLTWALRIGGDFTNDEFKKFTRRDVQLNQARLNRYVGEVGGQVRNVGEYLNDVAVDDLGNVYVVGAFRDSITAGKFKLTSDQSVTESYYDAMALKLNAAGQPVWAKQFGGAFDDDALTVGVDASRNVTIGGYYSRQVDVDPSSKTHLLRTEGRDAGYVVRLTTDGNFAWAYQFDSDSIGTDERNAVNDLVVTPRGEVYFDGTYASDARFRASDTKADRVVLKSEGKTDAFVARLNRKGTLVWAESTGGKDYDGNNAITLDADGNVYTAGYFLDEADVDPRADVEKIYKSTPRDGDNHAQFTDILVSKFAADGTPVWQDQLGGSFIETVSDITVGPDGGIYTTGSFFNVADFDPGRGTYSLSSTLTNDGSIKDQNTLFGRNESYDWFVSKLSPRGKFVAAAKFGEADDDYAAGTIGFNDGNLLTYGRAVKAVGSRDDRQEQSLIYLLSPELKIL